MSDQALAIVARLYEVLSPDDIVAAMADTEQDRLIRATLEQLAAPDFEVYMRGPAELGGAEFRGRGADGFRQVWQEWIEPFEAFQIESERMIEAGDDVLDLVRLTATSKTGGIEVEHEGAAVWTVRDGKLVRAAFFLDREEARKAAGIDPDRHSSD